MEPQAFGKYLLTERLATGGMAEVFRAIYQGAAGVEKIVALKRILPGLDAAPDFVTMFIDEARIAASLTHVNVAQVFEFGEAGGSYYLAMELVEGADLGHLHAAARRRSMTLPKPVAAFLVAEAARGLAYAHEKRSSNGALLGIVHRDVSPQNILVSYSGEVKIADFGIAKAVGKLHKTESGAVMGKMRYMSPEQVTGEPLDGRSDIFSLGVVLHELLTGKPLFDGDNPGRVADQVKLAEVEPPSKSAPDVPPELDRICLKALARARDARYERAAELARELSTFVSERAPGLTREDVGALVAELEPRELEPRDSDAPVEAGATTVEHPLASPSPAGSRASASSAAATRAARATPPRPGANFANPAGRSANGGAGADGSETGARPRPRLVLAVLLGLAAALAGVAVVFRDRVVPSATPDSKIPALLVTDGGALAAAPADAAAPLVPRKTATPAERAQLVAELEALPRASSSWRGVQSDDYLALLTAAEGTLCASNGGEPTIPPEVLERVDQLHLRPETIAVARYLRRVGELPPRVADSLRSFLRAGHPSYSPGAAGWGFAALAMQVEPARADHVFALLHENSFYRRWRERPPLFLPSEKLLCDPGWVVERLAESAPGPRVEALRRYLRAGAFDTPREVGGVRYTVFAAERDEAAGAIVLRVRVANAGAEAKPVALGVARLAGSDGAPAIEPAPDAIGPGAVREHVLRFTGAGDGVAEAAVLLLAPDVELQGYSEDLR